MNKVVACRVVAEFYRGIDFPPNWADDPANMITAGLAHARMASVIVLLDSDEHPLAACWQLDACEEKFVRGNDDGSANDNLLAGLNDDLAYQSQRDTGHPELYATLLWEPESLTTAQGTVVHPPDVGPFYDPLAEEQGWNVATRELVAKSASLVLVTRRNTTGLALPVPDDAAATHREAGDGDKTTYVVLPTPSVI